MCLKGIHSPVLHNYVKFYEDDRAKNYNAVYLEVNILFYCSKIK
jgi:hypothetical protein